MRQLLRSELELGGYQIVEAADGQEGIELAAEAKPNLILLDISLPDMCGQLVLDNLRSWTSAPVMVVSGEDSQRIKVNLLDAGANDYLTKPFDPAELLARLRARLRDTSHSRPQESDPVYINRDLVVDRLTRRVFRGDREIQLTPTEYRLLLIFVNNPDQVLTHEQILEQVWGADCVGRDHYVRVYIAHLRRKIEDNPAEPQFLITETGVGYRLRCA